MDEITGKPMQTISCIDIARCGSIEAHLGYHRNDHGQADADYLLHRHCPM